MQEDTLLASRVRRFMRGIPGQLVNMSPVDDPPNETKKLRAKLILEEAFELIQEGLGISIFYGLSRDERLLLKADRLDYSVDRPYDAVALLDGSVDLSVVNVGTLISAGIRDAHPLTMVCDNNDRKLERGTIREDGKLVKPSDHQPPDFAGEIARQRQLGYFYQLSVEFENWAEENLNAQLETDEGEFYTNPVIQGAWRAWCAARGIDDA